MVMGAATFNFSAPRGGGDVAALFLRRRATATDPPILRILLNSPN